MKHCKPCEGGMAALSKSEAVSLHQTIETWELSEKQISKSYLFKNFAKAMEFVNRVAAIAESEGHHPDLLIHDYKKVKITLWTHAVGGLTENDFILAEKIDALG
jgi:4a-hydroxytetrahydrobiopterin dehydratase